MLSPSLIVPHTSIAPSRKQKKEEKFWNEYLHLGMIIAEHGMIFPSHTMIFVSDTSRFGLNIKCLDEDAPLPPPAPREYHYEYHYSPQNTVRNEGTQNVDAAHISTRLKPVI